MGPDTACTRSSPTDQASPSKFWGTRPTEGRRPTTPQKEAGMRREPPRSDPVANHTCQEKNTKVYAGRRRCMSLRDQSSPRSTPANNTTGMPTSCSTCIVGRDCLYWCVICMVCIWTRDCHLHCMTLWVELDCQGIGAAVRANLRLHALLSLLPFICYYQKWPPALQVTPPVAAQFPPPPPPPQQPLVYNAHVALHLSLSEPACGFAGC